LHIELIDGTMKEYTFEDDERYDYSFYDHGYRISLNRLEKEFNDGSSKRFQERLFIPYSSIKMLRERFEYHIEEEDIFNLIERHCIQNEGINGIAYADIKEKLVSNGVKFSEKGLKDILEELKDESKIHKSIVNTNAWVTKKVYDKELEEKKIRELFP